MKILIIGSGGREHALAWKSAQNPAVEKVFIAPGNPGMALDKKLHPVAINIDEWQKLVHLVQQEQIALTIVGPEGALTAGIVDYFQQHNLICFGPNQYAAQLEGSKIFAKEFLTQVQIPTAAYAEFSDYDDAASYADTQKLPLVIKADGLAAGKGVFIAHTRAEVTTYLTQLLIDHSLGQAGKKIILEEFIMGEEVSIMLLTDGTNYSLLPNSQDHKQIGENDTGENTGGMGAYSPTSLLSPQLEKKICTAIIEPTLAGMLKHNNPYVGFLYIGLMITPDNTPYVLEYNCRLGDPETQVLMMRLDSDLATICINTLANKLTPLNITKMSSVAVVMTASGYPHSYARGDLITAPNITAAQSKIFYSGVSAKDKQLFTAGGRVLTSVAVADNIQAARDIAYKCAAKIKFKGAYYRRDIGAKELQRNLSS